MAVSDGKPLVEATHVAKALQIKKSAEEQIKAFSYGQ
jgi:predicted ATP-dependent protease